MPICELLSFKPLYQERVWGGRALELVLGRTLPAGKCIGESWDIVDRSEAQSEVASGEFAGKPLRAVIAAHAADIMGPDWPADKAFPVLVKWLDCRERLSLQVHPPARVAALLGGEPKTENWYIAAAEPGASLIVGLKPGVTRVQFEKALAEGTVEECLHRYSVSVGDSIFVESGTVHAIDAGNVILEIQQNSDTTYRVYDWGRLGLDGQPRQMHLRESLESIDWTDREPAPLHPADGPAVLADGHDFRIRRVPLAAGEVLRFAAREQPRLLHVVSGRLAPDRSSSILAQGDNVLLPYAGEFAFTTREAATVLLTENFNH